MTHVYKKNITILNTYLRWILYRTQLESALLKLIATTINYSGRLLRIMIRTKRIRAAMCKQVIISLINITILIPLHGTYMQ